jgi:hypothetical protein
MTKDLSQTIPSFLGHLIDRALGRSDPVIPRSPSFFETSRSLRDPLVATSEIDTRQRGEYETNTACDLKAVQPSLSLPNENGSIPTNAKSELDASHSAAVNDYFRRGVAKVESRTEAIDHVPATVNTAAPSMESSEERRSFVEPVRKTFSQAEDKRTVLPNEQQGTIVLTTRSRKDSPQKKQNQLSLHMTPIFPLFGFSPGRNQPQETADNGGRRLGLSPHIRLRIGELVDAEANHAIDAREEHVQTDPLSNTSEHQLFTGLMVPKASPIIRAPFGSTRYADDGKTFPVIETVRTDPGPVVNVTIGRIEVRAVPDQAKVSESRNIITKSNAMSLGEYLKRRGGRG